MEIECSSINGLATIYLNDNICKLKFSNAKHDLFTLEWNNYSTYNANNFSLYGKLNERNDANVPYIFCKNDSFKIPSEIIFDKHNANYGAYHKSTSKDIEDVVDFNLFLIERFKKIKTISKYDCILPWYVNKLDRMFIIDSLNETVFIDHIKNKIHIKNSGFKEFIDYQKYLELRAFQ